MRGRTLAEAAVVIAVATVLTALMTYPLAVSPGRVGRIDTSDGQFSIWNVAWVARTLVTDPTHVFDANIFYPHRGTLAYAESNLGAGALAIPAYWATRNPYFAHNLVVLLSFVLAAVSMYTLVRQLTGSRAAAAVAGVLFAFCPYTYARTAHIQLLLTATLPLTLFAFHRLVERPDWRRGLVLGLVLALTAVSCGYYAVFAALLTGFVSIFFLVSRRYWATPRYYAALVVGAVVACVLVWPVLKPYLALDAAGKPFRELEDATEFSANWSAYLAAAGFGQVWLLRFARGWTDVLFPGFVTIALAVAGLASFLGLRRAAHVERSHRETAICYGLIGTTAFWLSFGPPAGLYSFFYRFVPLFTLLRAPARFGLIVLMALIVLGALGLARLLEGRRYGAWIAAGIAGLAMLESAAIPLPVRQVPPVAPVYAALAHAAKGPVAEFPFFYRPEDFHQHAQYVLQSTVHWQPLINGFSDFYPDDFKAMVVPLSSFPTAEAFGILERHHCRYVVMHLQGYDHRLKPGVVERLEQFREYLRPMVIDGDNRLYEIVGWPH